MVTVLMAVYNGGEYLKKQLESIKNQTYSEWRLIVRDDMSSDNSVEVIKKFADSVSQEVIIKKNNPGSGSAKNNFARLIKDAAGSEYVMFSAQDDIWKEDKIEKTLEKMKQGEGSAKSDVPVLVHGDVEVVDKDENITAESMFKLSHIPVRQEL